MESLIFASEPLDTSKFLNFVKENNIYLDEVYLEFIKKYNACGLEYNVVSNISKECCISVFYGFCEDDCMDIIRVIESLDGEIPYGFIPIASTESDNIILLDVTGSNKGIFLWLHEESDNTLETCIKLFGDFKTFIDNIKPYVEG